MKMSVINEYTYLPTTNLRSRKKRNIVLKKLGKIK